MTPSHDGALEQRAITTAALVTRYGEPHRAYHSLAHVHAVLDAVQTLANALADAAPSAGSDLTAVRLAAWFHDAVYDPLRTDNEARSADLAAAALLAVGADHVLVAEVARLVRLTAHHSPAPGDLDGGLLCDADLAVLAGLPETYAAYVAGVREEYAMLDEPTWRAGRGAVLRALLARPQIYRTAPGFAWFEGAARANLLGELAGLG